MKKTPLQLFSASRNTNLGLMSLVVLANSLVPLCLALAGLNGLGLGISVICGAGLGNAVFFLLRYRWLWSTLKKEKWQVLTAFTQVDFLFTTLSRFYWPIFILAGMLVNPASVAVITGLWPIFFILLLHRNMRGVEKKRRYHKLTGELFIFLGLAFLGLAFVIAGQNGGQLQIVDNSRMQITGLSLALGAALLPAISAFRFTWALKLLRQLRYRPRAKKLRETETGLSILGITAATWVAGLILLTAGWGMNILPTWQDVVWGGLIGLTLVSAETTLMTVVNLRTKHLSINALAYCAPLLSAVLLILFRQVDEILPVYIITGAALILTANLALHRNR